MTVIKKKLVWKIQNKMIKDDLPVELPRSVKLNFKLTEEQVGPFPVSIESIWCDIEGKYFRVKNIPFFVDQISFDDLISVVVLPDDLVELRRIVKRSKNSTVWIYVKDELNGKSTLDVLQNLGCGVEGGVLDGYFAVNIPATVSITDINSVIDPAEENNWLAVDYPSMRH